jgi:dihydrodipicolinate synthase/N-acetylneuraminate lyase
MIMPEKIPFGVIAPMTTPFAADGELQATSIRSQVEFLVRERADSLAVGGSTGEGQTLSPDELRACVSETRAAMPPEMPLIASAIVDSTRQAIRLIKAVEGLGVDAIQLTPVHYLFRPDDEMMIEHFRVIHEETGMPLIIYNVVHWCYLSPELAVRLMNEVPGVMGIKQSAGDLKLFADLMINAPKDRRIYSAVDALMYPSFCLGTPGVIATGYAIGYGAARLLGLDTRDSRTMALEVGLQNGGMATGLPFNVLHSPAAALAAATFGPWSAITSSSLASWWGRRSIPQDTSNRQSA